MQRPASPIREHAPAKINLALHVTGRRDDGYHLLDTLVVFTEAGDGIAAEPAAQDRLTVSGPYSSGLDAPDNLVARARELLRGLSSEAARPAALHLEKNLPVASGIGGGSSDAAAALKALARLWRLDIAPERMRRASLPLGADLPMCLAARPLIARGIGENLEFLPEFPRLFLVLVNPGIAVPTPAVFRELSSRDNPPLPPLPPGLGPAQLVEWLAGTRNDLQEPAIRIAPQIDAALRSLSDAGADFARMSGSGATCFGIFASGEQAQEAATRIAARHPAWYVKATRTLEKQAGHGAD